MYYIDALPKAKVSPCKLKILDETLIRVFFLIAGHM